MSSRQLKNAVAVPTAELEDWGRPKNVGDSTCHLRGIQLVENPDGSEGGVWECTPGDFVREIVQAELTTFLSGRAIFHPEEGEPIEILAGDVLYFPENTRGTWEALEAVRKAYLCFDLGKA
jgi:uncharacterized cupin superfamily protein